MVKLHNNGLIKKIQEYEEVLDNIKRIVIKKLDDAKILIDADDKLPDDITFKK